MEPKPTAMSVYLQALKDGAVIEAVLIRAAIAKEIEDQRARRQAELTAATGAIPVNDPVLCAGHDAQSALSERVVPRMDNWPSWSDEERARYETELHRVAVFARDEARRLAADLPRG